MPEGDTRDSADNSFPRRLGVLYSCPTTVLREVSPALLEILDQGIKHISEPCASTSSRCIMATSSGGAGKRHHHDHGISTVISSGMVTDSGRMWTPIRQVFCRQLLLSKRPTATPGDNCRTARDEARDEKPIDETFELQEALLHLYKNVRVVPSLEPSDAPDGGLGEERDNDGIDTPSLASDLRRRDGPERSTPRIPLEECKRLHAGLVPLLSPLVKTDKRIFLVRRERGHGTNGADGFMRSLEKYRSNMLR